LQVALKYWRGVDKATKSNFRFLHISTDEVFGSLGEQGSFSEQSAYDPRSPYAASKAAADHLVRAFSHTHQLPVIVVHPSNNYGPNQHPEKLIPMVIRCCLLEQPIPIYGTGANVRDWLYVEDHCRAILQILSDGRVGESYNVSGGNKWQNLSLVQTLCDLIDELQPRPSSDRPPSRSLIRLVADRPGHDFRYSLDCSKIKCELGWTAVHSGLEGFRKTIKWYLQNTRRLGIEN
jgi:dTDP-glucose 4,6-dehydratase